MPAPDMAHDNAPDDFDWVSAQAQCSASSMFEILRTRVREDVQRRNGLRRDDGWTFEFDEEGDAFDVSRLDGLPHGRPSVLASVRFAREGTRINVQGEDVNVDFTAVVSLDVSGACRFVVGEAMYADWEIRRMALELLFFEEFEDQR